MAGEEKPTAAPEPEKAPEAKGKEGLDEKERLAAAERERDEFRVKFEKEHEERLKNLGTVEQANQALAEIQRRARATDGDARGNDPTALTPEDVDTLRILAQHEDAGTRAVARSQLAALRGVVDNANEIAIAHAPDAIRDQVRTAWRTGNFRTVEFARAHVEAEAKAKALDPMAAENAALKKRVADLEATPATPGTHTRAAPGGPKGTQDRETVTLADYQRIHNERDSRGLPTPEANRLYDKERAGLLDVV